MTPEGRDKGQATKPGPRWLRWIARIWGSSVAFYWVFALVASTIVKLANHTLQRSAEGAILSLLVAVCALGVIIAWRREYTGGLIVLSGGFALGVFACFSAGHNQWFAVLVSGFPFFLAGILFLVSSKLARDT